ncbi:arsenate reductase (glutaredoxin) [Capnocytophaga ochracea]|uniref:arsenate reductase (glutaredoxin) n=1 Tax=Capnocytophaga ochracea TaxID=1018 RepID=UPI002B48512A|nr:arsenate reductase (glutaredoxin) [Capnocytophaga ochracea]MEB3016550.1 arsenate reductase (glutaredoxin) [Capnocytophaga ochracea]MEB3037235.1 arsenate reductase (glutaredoxin) [Capnocytophaga ochracea]
MITIYHNPKCSKSRCGLELLKDSGKEYQIVDYLKKGISKEELKNLLTKLQMSPIELVRTKENIWKELFKGKTLTDDEVIEAMIQYPQLIERPIVIVGDKAVIGRPTERIKEII